MLGDHKLPLTKTQINRIQKSKTGLDLNLSATQLKHLEKTGGFFSLFAALAPILAPIFGGIGAAGAAVGGTAAIVTAVKNVKAQNAAQTEAERHNRAIEE